MSKIGLPNEISNHREASIRQVFSKFSIANCHHLKAEYSLIKAIYIRVPTYSCSLLYLNTIFVFIFSYVLESNFLESLSYGMPSNVPLFCPSNYQSLFLIITRMAFAENCFIFHTNLYNKYRLLAKSCFSGNFLYISAAMHQ